MNFYRVNTDKNARQDIKTCDLWYECGLMITGDSEIITKRHDTVFKKVKPGDGIFMHHSDIGLVGYGIVIDEWNEKIYTGNERLLYVVEPYEYRIRVSWIPAYDCRDNPLSIHKRLPYMGTYSKIDSGKYDIDKVLKEMQLNNLEKGLRIVLKKGDPTHA